jgi:hypothetical protein
VILSCKESPKEIDKEVDASKMIAEIDDSMYPEALQKIFTAHGGLSAWKNKRVLSYEIVKEEGNEKQTIDLHTRNEIIETANFATGYDGKEFWLKDEKESYKGDPIFYHNLMFYFYAMPFVLADDGIVYSETETLEFEGVSYPGVRISYNDGVGVSSKDEYFLHYNPETFQMEWLGYTVTFRSGEKSDKISWIRYNDWTNVNDLRLSKSLTWHNYEGREIKEARSTRNFENIVLSESAKPENFFNVPEGAKIVTRE